MDRLASGGGVEDGGNDDSSSTRHYFSAEPSDRDQRESFEVKGLWGTLHMESASGVFASRGLDRGTEVLLDSLRRHPISTPPDGSLAVDLGCGSGVLALVMARLWPACRVMAVDVNSRALEVCAANARRNGITNVETRLPEETQAEAVARLWSNPPVRIGKEALHALLDRWMPLLPPDGEARMVVGRHLGSDSLAGWMDTRGWAVERLASARGFRVLRVCVPAKAQ
jgi:16S rRNA (guanine1207-N2)-methyltransferase